MPLLSAPALVCAGCHPRETERYLLSPMANSIAPPTPVPAGRALHQRSGSTIDVAQRAGRMFHRLSERGLTAEYEIRYQIGAGILAHS